MARLLSIATASLLALGTLSLSAQQQAVTTTARAATTATKAMTKAAAAKARQAGLTMIQGNALTSANGHLNGAVVRLRDAQYGRIVDTQLTDETGLFAFKALDPGNYIIEVMSNDQTILAASQMMSVNAGEAVSAVVKLPFRIPQFAGLMGSTSTPSAAAVATEAAASSIAAIVPTVAVSPPG